MRASGVGSRVSAAAATLLVALLAGCGERGAAGDTARDTTVVVPPAAPTGSLAVPNPDSVPPGESTGATAATVPPDSVENTSRGPSGPTPLPMPRP